MRGFKRHNSTWNRHIIWEVFHVVGSGQQCPMFNKVTGDKNQVSTGFSRRCYGSYGLAKAVLEGSLERKLQRDAGGNLKGPKERGREYCTGREGGTRLKGWRFKG